MRKVYSFSIVVFLFIVCVILVMGWNERNPTFATHLEALENDKHIKYEIKEIIDTKIYGDNAYVISYTNIESQEHYFITTYKKGKKGWSFVDASLGFELSRKNANGRIKVGGIQGGSQHGIATWDVDKVTLANLSADIIPLEEKNLKIWIFFNPTLEDMKSEMLFKDENGKLIN
ncbi:hypothetical protein [Bacillus alkalisoli]|uniref:hypothetical protein n=1 Tax=Bacillus alkalisoli TaxID=2011008 RepID=UPI000C247304|nr:hypothetical protein [Bacillus alkalisoli]